MSMELIEGERVQIIKPGDRFQGDEGTITGVVGIEVEVKLDTGRYTYYLREEITRVDEYEYAYQKSFGNVVRKIDESEWATHEKARNQLLYHGDKGTDPTWGGWTAKVVKRRKAGPIQDV